MDGWTGPRPAYIFSGVPSGTMDVSAATAVIGPDPEGYTRKVDFRSSYSPFVVGDLDGDGLSELGIGRVGDRASGTFFVYAGAAGRGLAPRLSLSGSHDQTGAAACGLPDLDADGLPDLAVGAPGGAGDLAGDVAIFAGTTTGTFTSFDSAWAWYRGERNAHLGSAVATGDLDGDGSPDLLVGAPGDEQVWLVLAPPSVQTDIVNIGETISGKDGWLGYAVASPGDLDGDGKDDALIGAPLLDRGAGGAYVFTGLDRGALTTADATATLTSGMAVGWTGLRVEGADLDGDGVSELVIGDLADDACEQAHVRIFRGPLTGAHDVADADVTFQDNRVPASTNVVEMYVALPGDLDGNGFGDVVLSDPGEGPDAGFGAWYAGPLW